MKWFIGEGKVGCMEDCFHIFWRKIYGINRERRHRRNFFYPLSYSEQTTKKIIFHFLLLHLHLFQHSKKQHKNICFNLISTFVRKKFLNYIANFPIVCIFTKQIFYLTGIYASYTIAKHIGYPNQYNSHNQITQHPGVVFFPKLEPSCSSLSQSNPRHNKH